MQLPSAGRRLFDRAGILRGSGPLSQIETFVTFCGIVWLRAKVLGQMGWTTSPYLRAGALSCPSLAIDGPGSYGAPAFRFAAPPRLDALSPRARARVGRLKKLKKLVVAAY